MSRNKLSPYDKIKNYTTKPSELLEENNELKVIEYIKTIRSKALQSLCLFCWNRVTNYNFIVSNTTSELAKGFGCGQRKVYDLIKVANFIAACDDVGFGKITQLISQEQK